MSDSEKWFCTVSSRSWTHDSYDVVFSDRPSIHAHNKEELKEICKKYERLGYINRNNERRVE